MVVMMLSMAAFAVADTLVKVSSSFLSPAQILFFLMGGGLVLFALTAKLQGEKLIDPRVFAGKGGHHEPQVQVVQLDRRLCSTSS